MMLHPANKSLLMFVLEALPGNQAPDTTNTQGSGDHVNCYRVRVDGMAEVQSVIKTECK